MPMTKSEGAMICAQSLLQVSEYVRTQDAAPSCIDRKAQKISKTNFTDFSAVGYFGRAYKHDSSG